MKTLSSRLLLLSLAFCCLISFALSIPAHSGNYEIDGRPGTEQDYQAATLVSSGIALLRQNKNALAADAFDQAVRLSPGLAAAHADYAIALAKLGKSDQAIDQLQVALQLNPNEAAGWLNLGSLYQGQGQLDKALSSFNEYLRRFPNSPDAPKVRSLVQGLTKLNASFAGSGSSSTGGSAVNQSSSANSTADSQEASATAPEQDYFKEATFRGIYRWPADSMPIRVCIRSGIGVPGFKIPYTGILQEAFEDWAKVSDGVVSFTFVEEPAQANIVCSWTNDPSRVANAAEAGETRLSTNSRGIVHATIVLLTVPLSAALPLTPNSLRLISLHEIGHALGLAGHTKNPTDIMFYSEQIADTRRELSKRDKNTLVRLYSETSRK